MASLAAASTRRIQLTIAYNGSKYHGWARNRKRPQLPTVQQSVEDALSDTLRGRSKLETGAVLDSPDIVAGSRTDAGVHALGQVAHVDIDTSTLAAFTKPDPPEEGVTLPEMTRSLNHHLRTSNHSDIAIISASVASKKFHARYSAIHRTYVYRLLIYGDNPEDKRSNPQGTFGHDPFSTDCVMSMLVGARSPTEEGDVWRVVGGVNIQTMKETAMILEGTHDFWAFRKTRGPEAVNGDMTDATRSCAEGIAFTNEAEESEIVMSASNPSLPKPSNQNSVRTIDYIDVRAVSYENYYWWGKWISPAPDSLCTPSRSPIFVEVEVRSRSFVHHQVRKIVASLVAVGKGRLRTEDLKAALADNVCRQHLSDDEYENALTAREERHRRLLSLSMAPPHGLSLVHVAYPE